MLVWPVIGSKKANSLNISAEENFLFRLFIISILHKGFRHYLYQDDGYRQDVVHRFLVLYLSPRLVRLGRKSPNNYIYHNICLHKAGSQKAEPHVATGSSALKPPHRISSVYGNLNLSMEVQPQ